MSDDINQLEQRAMQFQAKGKDDDALKEYLKILKLDPNSRRIRKTVGDIYLKLGDTRSAERRYLEVVESMRKDGQYRMAIPLYKELSKLRPKDPDMYVELGDCYIRANFSNDAITCYVKAVEMTHRQKPEFAQEIQRKVCNLKPADLSERVRLAEILEHANWSEKSSEEWSNLAAISRKIGKPDDQAIFLERALAVREHWTLRRDAARARLESGDSRKALEILKPIYKTHSGDADVCMLLAEGLQKLKKVQQASKVWLQAADICIEQRRYDDLLICYRSAQACGVQDPDIAKKIEKADAEEKKTHLRLHTQSWAAPKGSEVSTVFRAELLWEYGQFELARKTLKDISTRSVAAAILRAEIAFSLDDYNAGVEEIQKLSNLSQDAQIDIQTRLTVLGLLTDDDEVLDDIIEDDLMDDDLMDDDLGGDDLADESLGSDSFEDTNVDSNEEPQEENSIDSLVIQAESLAADGDLEGAIDVYTKVLDLDSNNEHALTRIPELMTMGNSDDTFGTLEEDGDFVDIDPEQFSFAEPSVMSSPEVIVSTPAPAVVQGAEDGDTLCTARAYVLIGMENKAIELLKDSKDVASLAVLGKAQLQKEDLRTARNTLEDALEDVSEGSLDHLEILWSLAQVFTQQEKARSALRILDDISSTDPAWRKRDIEAWRRGLDILRG